MPKLEKKNCFNCNRDFEKPASYFRGELKKKLHRNKTQKTTIEWFCCSACAYTYRTVLEKVKTNCKFCKTEIQLDVNAFNRKKEHFCDITCYRNQRNIGKSKKQLICPQCNTKFENSVNQINGKIRKGSKHIYCSSKCSSEAQRNDSSRDFTIQCDECGENSIRKGWQLKLTKFHFCSPTCKGTYFARINALGEKRSKLEVKLEEHIRLAYPTINLIINDRKELGGLEFDFWFPDFRFAIEVNGPAHFTPIYGDESLFRTRKRDIIKKNYCKKKRIRLLELTETLHPYNDNSKEIFDNHVKPIMDTIIALVA